MPSDAETIAPFRWDLHKREQLGQLLEGEASVLPGERLPEFREIVAKIVARAGNADLVFVGRSPENLFDYLSGAFSTLSRSLTLLQLSYRTSPTIDLTFAGLAPFLKYLGEEGLNPQALAASGNSVRRMRAGLDDVRLHDLRHTFASVGAASGLSLPLIGALLGHKDSATTARYSHIGEDPVRQATERVGQRIADAMAQRDGGADVIKLK